MKGFKRGWAVLLCVLMLASVMTGAVAAETESLLVFSEFVDGTNITEVTSEDASYDPIEGYNGSYWKTANGSSFVTPRAGVMEAGSDYKFSFRYKTTTSRQIRIHLYHVNSAENGGTQFDIGSYLGLNNAYVSFTPAVTEGEWGVHELLISAPDYLTWDASDLLEGIVTEGSYITIGFNFRSGDAEMQLADVRLEKITNKVSNNDFEIYDATSLTTAPTGWVFSGEENGADKDANSTKTVEVEDGNAFVKLVPAVTNLNRMPYVRQTIVGLKPSTQYRLSFAFRTTSVTENHAMPCLSLIQYYTPNGETADRKTSVEWSHAGFRYAPTFGAFGDKSIASSGAYYYQTAIKLSDAAAGVWTDYTVYFITPATENNGTVSVVLYLQGNGNGSDGTNIAETCYDDVVLEEDYTEVKLYDTEGNPLDELEKGEEAVVKLHYVPQTLSTDVIDVILAAYTKNGNVTALKDIDIVSAAPAGSVAFAENDQGYTPSPLCIMPQDYTLRINVPSTIDGETVSVSAFFLDGMTKLSPKEAPITISVQ